MKIFISALRRSGSTIFWRCFREASVAKSFDEPFNPKIFQLPKENVKDTMGEFTELLSEQKKHFWELFSPIYPQDELREDLTTKQSNYLKFLLSQDENVVVDSTRCWHKISSLEKVLDSDTYLIHLHRAPASWVTSHMLPSEEKSVRHSLLNFRRKKTFWTRRSDFNRWNLEDILGYERLSPFHLTFLKNDQLAKNFYESAAVSRLLKFWTLSFEEVESVGKSVFREKFISVRFEDFCSEPRKTLQHIGDKTGLAINFEKIPTIKSPSPAFMSASEEWKTAARYCGLPDNPESIHRERQ